MFYVHFPAFVALDVLVKSVSAVVLLLSNQTFN